MPTTKPGTRQWADITRGHCASTGNTLDSTTYPAESGTSPRRHASSRRWRPSPCGTTRSLNLPQEVLSAQAAPWNGGGSLAAPVLRAFPCLHCVSQRAPWRIGGVANAGRHLIESIDATNSSMSCCATGTLAPSSANTTVQVPRIARSPKGRSPALQGHVSEIAQRFRPTFAAGTA